MPGAPQTRAAAPAAYVTPPELESLALADGFSAAFVPSQSAVAVVSQPVLDLLRRMRDPSPADSLSAQEQAAALDLLSCGLLRPAGAPPPRPEPAHELSVWLHVTNACNLRCTYCYITKSHEHMGSEVALRAVDTALDAARRHGYAGVQLKYAGGEAALNLPLAAVAHRYALERAGDLRLRGVVLSNGVGLARQDLALIRELGLQLMISLDGPAEIHDRQRPRLGGQGSYSAAIASIELARQLGIELTVSVTITGQSAPALGELVRWLLERKIHFTLNFYRECDNSASRHELALEEERLIAGMRAAYDEIGRHLPAYSLLGCLLDRAHLGAAHSKTCAAGENYLVIDQRGRIARCQMEIGAPLTDLSHPDPLSVIRLDPRGVQNLPVEEKEGCRSCAWRYWCAGGCALATYRATGRYDVRSPNCRVYKALYPDVIRLEGLRLLALHRTPSHAAPPTPA